MFAYSFDKKSNHCNWTKVGAAAIIFNGECEGTDTQDCLMNNRAHRELGDATGKTNRMMVEIQEANNLTVCFLDVRGYEGDLFKIKIKEVKFHTLVTVPNSKERTEALSKATGHGQKFMVTGGGHLTSDDIFKSFEVEIYRENIKKLKDRKMELMERAVIVMKAEEVTEKNVAENIVVLSKTTKKYFVDVRLA